MDTSDESNLLTTMITYSSLAQSTTIVSFTTGYNTQTDTFSSQSFPMLTQRNGIGPMQIDILLNNIFFGNRLAFLVFEHIQQ